MRISFFVFLVVSSVLVVSLVLVANLVLVVSPVLVCPNSVLKKASLWVQAFKAPQRFAQNLFRTARGPNSHKSVQ